MADTAYQRAKQLQAYVKRNGPKYGPSLSEPSGSGPGGAAATNKVVSRALANAAKSPLNTGQDNDTRDYIRQDTNDFKMTRATNQMKEVRDIYSNAADTLKKASGRRKKFKDI